MRYSEFLEAMENLIHNHLTDVKDGSRVGQWTGELFGVRVVVTTDSPQLWDPKNVSLIISMNGMQRLNIPHNIKLEPQWVLALTHQSLDQY